MRPVVRRSFRLAAGVLLVRAATIRSLASCPPLRRPARVADERTGHHPAGHRRLEQSRDVGSRRRPAPHVRADVAFGRAIAVVWICDRAARRHAEVIARSRIPATACGWKPSCRTMSRPGTASTTTNGRPRDAAARIASVPRIGAARSHDRGRTWEDLGVVIQARRELDGVRVDEQVRDWRRRRSQRDARSRQAVSLHLLQPVSGAAESQGVAVARLQWADRDRPSGTVEIWRDGIWDPDAGRREFMHGLAGASVRRLEWTYLRRHAAHRADASPGTMATTRSMRSGDRRCTGTPRSSST